MPKPIRDAVGGHAWVRAMLDAEAALARAEARAGVIPADAADQIARACEAEFDPEQIGEEGRRVANPAEPLVRRQTKHVQHRLAAEDRPEKPALGPGLGHVFCRQRNAGQSCRQEPPAKRPQHDRH